MRASRVNRNRPGFIGRSRRGTSKIKAGSSTMSRPSTREALDRGYRSAPNRSSNLRPPGPGGSRNRWQSQPRDHHGRFSNRPGTTGRISAPRKPVGDFEPGGIFNPL